MALGNLAQRALVAVVAAPLLYLLIIYIQRPEPTWALVLAASLLSMRELFGMMIRAPRARPIARPAWCSARWRRAALYWLHPGALGASPRTMSLAGLGPLVAMVFCIIAPALYYLFRFGNQQTVAPRMVATMAGIIYAGLLLTFLALAKRDFGPTAAPS
jgi:hypothetical protein